MIGKEAGIEKGDFRGEMMSEFSLRPGYRPALPGNIAAELRSLIRPGDIFITRKEHALTNYFFPGY